MKSNSIFLLTTVAAVTAISVLMMSTIVTNNPNYNAVAQTENVTESRPHFYASLTNSGSPFMDANTNASGYATFTLADDGSSMYYVINGSNVEGNITQIALSTTTGGRYTDLAIFHYAPSQGLITQGTGSIEGILTSADFINIAAGKSMLDMVKRILDGNVYLRGTYC